MRSVVGIDATWTDRELSGVALVADNGRGWGLAAVAASYSAFIAEHCSDHVTRHRGSIPNARALLNTAAQRVGSAIDVVAIDMPLSLAPIIGRRVSDNLISAQYGAKHASTHTPSATRPGKLSDDLRLAFEREGYSLAVSQRHPQALLEVYPHPALIELATANRRLPYMLSKIRNYWPNENPAARRGNPIQTWTNILGLLDAEVHGVKEALTLPLLDAPGWELKAFEGSLDAVGCAWVGECVIDGRARAYGDETSAIWVPEPRPRARFKG